MIDEIPHQRFLDEVGPAVTNLNFPVADISNAEALISGMHGKTLLKH
ncbi:MAG: hypothetical protein JRG84_21225, partial [Deltaproteobacteria bacterium]|nr:hypothetical protein [Deltaproteobacteria bacterium]